MEIKLGAFNLHYNQISTWIDGKWANGKMVAIGTRVCSSSNRKYLGVIADIVETTISRIYGPKDNQHDIAKLVTVYWQTGPNKGKVQQKDAVSLVNYEAYKAAIAEALSELEATEEEANKVGM